MRSFLKKVCDTFEQAVDECAGSFGKTIGEIQGKTTRQIKNLQYFLRLKN
jgi:hypothetical protein